MFERFTTAARAVVVSAQEHARVAQRPTIGAPDLLAAVLGQVDSVPARVLAGLGVEDPAETPVVEQTFDAEDGAALQSLGIDLEAVRQRAEQTFGPGAFDRRSRQRPGLFGRRAGAGHLPFSAEAKQSLELALREAIAERHRYLGPEHLFLGLLATDEGTVLRLLPRLGVREDRSALRRLVLAEVARRAA